MVHELKMNDERRVASGHYFPEFLCLGIIYATIFCVAHIAAKRTAARYRLDNLGLFAMRICETYLIRYKRSAPSSTSISMTVSGAMMVAIGV
jgi:hypothetical protein